MCIVNDDVKLVEQKSKTRRLTLWKIVKKDDEVGLWHETNPTKNDLQLFCIGEITAHDYIPKYESFVIPGAFHCFFTREVARSYLKYRTKMGVWQKLKIIKVYANSQDVVSLGTEKYSGLFAVSVSKMEIRSLKHQR